MKTNITLTNHSMPLEQADTGLIDNTPKARLPGSTQFVSMHEKYPEFASDYLENLKGSKDLEGSITVLKP